MSGRVSEKARVREGEGGGGQTDRGKGRKGRKRAG